MEVVETKAVVLTRVLVMVWTWWAGFGGVLSGTSCKRKGNAFMAWWPQRCAEHARGRIETRMVCEKRMMVICALFLGMSELFRRRNKRKRQETKQMDLQETYTQISRSCLIRGSN
jgi:hypothetical protein